MRYWSPLGKGYSLENVPLYHRAMRYALFEAKELMIASKLDNYGIIASVTSEINR